jgi:hypothetical protein
MVPPAIACRGRGRSVLVLEGVKRKKRGKRRTDTAVTGNGSKSRRVSGETLAVLDVRGEDLCREIGSEGEEKRNNKKKDEHPEIRGRRS